MELNDVYPALLAVFTGAVSLIALFKSMGKERTGYNQDLRRVELERMREFFEKELYSANEKLTSNERRWGELNHLVLEALSKTEGQTQDSDIESNKFVQNLGLDPKKILKPERKAFLLTPFHHRFDKTYDVVAATCQKIGLPCNRGDEKYIDGNILSHVMGEMLSSAVIIANLDGRNANVFYELGIAHALGKNVVMLSSSIKHVPFDLKSQRLVVWNTEDELQRELSNTLARLFLETV